MLQSNQPYHRVDDGIGAGLIGGAIIGGAAGWTANKAQKKYSSALGDGKMAKASKFAFGTGKRRAVTAGASMLAGGILGATIDGMNN